MPVVSCKCPNCDGGMIFSPEKQQFICEYCGAALTEEQMRTLAAEQQKAAEESAPAEGPVPEPPLEQSAPQSGSVQTAQEEFGAQGYSCPSCGAEVFTDSSTAATFCYYCHNPVVMSGRLSGALRPDKVIPFAIARAEAEQKFLAWCKSKWFLRKNFYSTVQLEKLTGVYFPFWMADAACDCQAVLDARTLRIWRVGDVEHTETSVYEIRQASDISFSEMSFPGIERDDVRLAQDVFPYDFEGAKDFSMGYLSGFQAEKRGLESHALEGPMRQMLDEYARALACSEVTGYQNVSITSANIRAIGETDWKYLLLPVWTLTCRYGDEIYYYALNGQNGKVCGRLPINKLRVALMGGAIGLGTAIIMLLLGGLLPW